TYGRSVWDLQVPQAGKPLPGLSSEAVSNGASLAAGAPVARGSIASVSGVNLASGSAVADTFPLTNSLGGVGLQINDPSPPAPATTFPVPLLSVSANQMVVQIPWELRIPVT